MSPQGLHHQQGLRFVVRRGDLTQTRIEPIDTSAALAPGAVRLRVERFALTANNITYAVFGESMKYWQFFPVADHGWGCIPVWGFARVEASACDGVAVGSTWYGYWPMATHVVLEPARIAGAAAFTDGAAHRAELPALYNRYQAVPTLAGYHAEREGEYALLRPLFATAWLIDDWLREAADFGAETLLLSSASSKTAYATAFCLQRSPQRSARVIGLSSPARLDFCRALGVYDEVLAYDQLGTLDAQGRSGYIDFAGDAALRRAIHGHWRDALAFSSAIGGTHHEALGSARDLPGPKAELFFAPARMAQRGAPPPAGLGRDGLLRQLDTAWTEFLQAIEQRGPGWLTVQSRRGTDAVREAYLEVLQGRSDPRVGMMLALA